ncbi:histidinol dehydrogenase [Sulfurihydrogenibium azorense Az-Fu1]|jgi:histidinol dehydrogenase|uniref:Histidinol dehydrogenase n=1 Tax=Sulfurihydrogenibium azorense (strain DSM 15241 / OCM 825 / Az-Fu1) TaxID=204536 RepID=C1DV57_SULAA|nr:histidinol dehydrogenase [Sulfurihydrogenibium azorense]ACN99527.1 histidinol dehydrogenase [Sulfurihydrogenibium azorense Az-Fu1]MDM7273188.1 histidinol dehydrogenase [Sulfurihydrogenibium azorense]
MKIVDLRGRYYKEVEEVQYLIKRSDVETDLYEAAVKEIIKNVKERGDEALVEYTEKFDKIKINPEDLIIPFEELEKAYDEIEEEVRWAFEVAYERLYEFHELQKEKSFFKEEDGIILGQKVVPLEKVGLYVPGGKAAYPSSVLMNAVPARVAGVEEIVMCSPNPNKYTLAAAFICGIDTVYRVGGAQAVAAMAYGTETVKKVDKIVGPGNIYVALAKKNVFGVVDIDMIAGPSEILVIADETANYKWVAADLLSQAEHDELAASILITTSEDLAKNVKNYLYNEILKDFSRKEIAEKSLNNYGHAFIVEDLETACELANYLAPEHLEVVTNNPFDLINKIKHAGAIFLGHYSTEPLGDYILGPNHVLPTSRSARFSSPLGVYDFVKRSSVIYVSKEGFERVANHAINMAKSEGLEAHALSVKVRKEDI